MLAGLADPRHGAIERHGGWAFVPERVALAPALRCGEWLRAMRGLRGLPPADWAAAAAASGLDPAVLDRPAGTLSKGMLQRVALLEALPVRRARCCCSTSRSPASTPTAATGSPPSSPARTAAGAAVLLTDHSGAARGTHRGHRGAAAVRRRVPAADGGRTGAVARCCVRASHPDGRRLERAVAEDAADAAAARRCSTTAGTSRRSAGERRRALPAAGATRTRAPLPALAATLFLVLGVFSYRRNEVGAHVGPDRAADLRARGLARRRRARRRAARPGGHGDGRARRPAGAAWCRSCCSRPPRRRCSPRPSSATRSRSSRSARPTSFGPRPCPATSPPRCSRTSAAACSAARSRVLFCAAPAQPPGERDRRGARGAPRARGDRRRGRAGRGGPRAARRRARHGRRRRRSPPAPAASRSPRRRLPPRRAGPRAAADRRRRWFAPRAAGYPRDRQGPRRGEESVVLSMLDRERTVAPPGYRRWLIPPAALAVHLSIGQVYAFSVFKEPLVEHFDTKLTPISVIFSIAIVMLGLSAAVGGTWVERSGPRKTMFVAACCWGARLRRRRRGRRGRPAVARLPRLRRDRRHRPRHRLHLAGLDADQVVPGPPGPRDRPGDHGLRRRRARRRAALGRAARRVRRQRPPTRSRPPSSRSAPSTS